MSQVKIPIHTHRFTKATYAPFERLNIDSMGPYPKDEYGNEYVLVIRDTFTRPIGLYATPDTSARHAAREIMQFCGWFGCPSEILTDGGPQFNNDTMTELCRLIGVEYNQTLRYSKEQNAMVERANKEVLRHLRNMLYDKRILTTWSDCLPLIQRIIMNEPIAHLGVSPAQLVFGNMINLDRGIILQRIYDDNPKRKSLSEWTDRRLRNR
jgi:transposase InsO family protein